MAKASIIMLAVVTLVAGFFGFKNQSVEDFVLIMAFGALVTIPILVGNYLNSVITSWLGNQLLKLAQKRAEARKDLEDRQ